jgi:hypothetical protein
MRPRKTLTVRAELQQYTLNLCDKQKYTPGQTKKEMMTPNGQHFEIYTR